MPTSCFSSAASSGAASTATGTATTGQGAGSWIFLIVLIVAMIAIMIIPQKKRDKKVKDMLNSLKPGDRVRTIGGIYGTISSIKDDVVVITVGPDKLKMVFARGAISQVEDTGVENTMDEEVTESKK